MAQKSVKCFVCGSPAKLVLKETRLFGGRIIVREDEFYECTKCKERFSTSRQMHSLEKKLREQYLIKRSIIETGRSLALTFPQEFAEFYKLKKGSTVTIVPSGKKEITIRFCN